MAYMIQYGGQVPVQQNTQRRRKRAWTLAACIFAGAVIVRQFFGDAIASILIPGEDSAVLEAFSGLLSGVTQGEALDQCVAAFCQEIIYGAP